MWAEVSKKNGSPILIVHCRNDSGTSITRASFCVRDSSQAMDSCLFNLWITHVWVPHEEIKWALTPNAPIDLASVDIALDEIRRVVPELAKVTTVYVLPFEGNVGEINAERILALLAASPRFKVINDPDLPHDAVIEGRAQSQAVGLSATTTERADSQMNGSAAIGVIGFPTLGRVRGATTGDQSAEKQSTSVTGSIVEETLILRLMQKGQILWGWEGSKGCIKPKPACAVEDLIDAAGNGPTR
jgi:hypothetical protein